MFRKLLASIPHGDVMLLSISMSIFMYCFDYERAAASPMICWILKKLGAGGNDEED